MEFFTNIRRSIHSATSSRTPWLSNSDLIDEYDREIAKNEKLLELGACGATAREARAEIKHYKNLRAVLLAG